MTYRTRLKYSLFINILHIIEKYADFRIEDLYKGQVSHTFLKHFYYG